MPFCGYNRADHWSHWLEIGKTLGAKAPKIFQVNWFRKGEDGSFLWPGFAENSRVLEWILERVDGRVPAVDTPLGWKPAEDGLNLEGVGVTRRDLEQLFEVDPQSWLAELEGTEQFFGTFGDRLPATLTTQLTDIRRRLKLSIEN
jgi:phosphoenolpyruvate carboxykinase (GTP)